MKGVLIRINETLHLMTPTEKKVAKYILENPNEVTNMSIQKLAKLSEVSEATIVRFTKTIKFEGFQELKLKLATEQAHLHTGPGTGTYQDILTDGSIAGIIDSISNNNIKSIEDTLKLLSVEAVIDSVNKLRKARKIAIFGIGASAVIAEDFKLKLTRINRWCEVGYNFDSQATIAANLLKEDVVLAISYSGQTEDTINSVEIAKVNGATIISLTKFGNSPLTKLADYLLFISSLEKSIRSGAMASRIAMLNIIDILYIGIAVDNVDQSIEYLERTRMAVSQSKLNR